MKRMTCFLLLIAALMCAQNASALQTVSGDITSDTTWTEDVLLQGPVFVKNNATLTVNAGVTVYGEKASIAALVIARGSKLIAIGTESDPVVFTSDQAAGTQQRADWGGLIINGYSTLNVTGGTKEGEGDTGTFGCSGADCNEADSSGTLQYVRVEYGGIQFSPDNELNGIAFQGTGSGTVVDHVQVHYSKDDCIEFFGGTTNIKYAIMTACGDDSLDWTDGWRGNAQFLVVQQKGDEADNGIEADNLDKANDNLPRSNPTIYNMTLIGDPTTGEGSTNGLTLRRGTAGTLKNFIVMGFKKNGIQINNEATFNQAVAGTLSFDNSIFFNNAPNYSTAVCDKGSDGNCAYTYPFTAEQFMTSTMLHNQQVDPQLGRPYDLVNPDFRPQSGSPASNGSVPVAAPPAGNSYIMATDYIGGVDPDDDWTRKTWTTYGPVCTDADGDTYFAEGGACGQKDCNDGDNTINPGATETCGDSKDNDCDGQTDEGCASTTTTSVSGGGGGGGGGGAGLKCTDADKDGYKKEGGQCGPVDCDDSDAAVYPGATEACGDSKDNDCDSQIDEGCEGPAPECTDADKDGFSTEGNECGPVDCNDSDAAINPDADEACDDSKDNNCDGQVDEGCEPPAPVGTDSDGDGYYAEGVDGKNVDCDDSDADINPGAQEVCGDKLDNNCDGQADEGCSSCPATQALGEDAPQLDILRSLRDAVMSQSLKGKTNTWLYYHYSAEVKSILATDPALKAEVADVIIDFMPTVQTALATSTVRLSTAEKDKIVSVLDAINSRASLGLQLCILKVKLDILFDSLL